MVRRCDERAMLDFDQISVRFIYTELLFCKRHIYISLSQATKINTKIDVSTITEATKINFMRNWALVFPTIKLRPGFSVVFPGRSSGYPLVYSSKVSSINACELLFLNEKLLFADARQKMLRQVITLLLLFGSHISKCVSIFAS